MSINRTVHNLGFYAEQYISRTPMPRMHDHEFFEVYYILHGNREYFISDRFYRVGEGELVIIPPGVLHRTAGGDATRILLHFTEDFLRRFLSEPLYRTLHCLGQVQVLHPAENGERVAEALLRLVNTFLACGAETEAPRLCALLFDTLFLLSEDKESVRSECTADDRLEAVVKYMNENFASIESIEQIAEKFFFSKYHLCHLFREHLGLSVISYLNIIKVRRACELLGGTDLGITEIAEQCGFHSTAYFCKVFRRLRMVRPTEFRRGKLVDLSKEERYGPKTPV